MGATNNIRNTNIWAIQDYKCSQCSQKFTEQDYSAGNFDLWFDTSGDIVFKKLENSKWWDLKLAVRDLTHKQYAVGLDNRPLFNCPYVEKCQTCSKKELVSAMKYIDWDKETEEGDEYYCFPCYQQISPNIKDHER